MDHPAARIGIPFALGLLALVRPNPSGADGPAPPFGEIASGPHRPVTPLDLARIRVEGPIQDRLDLSHRYLAAGETRLAVERSWGADQIARWLETMTLLGLYRGDPPSRLTGSLLAFLDRQNPDGSLLLGRGDALELWGATRSLLFLTTYYQQVDPDPRVLDAAVRLADHLRARIRVPDRVETLIHGDYHSLTRGYAALGEITGERRFLDAARALVRVIDPEVASPGKEPLVHTPMAWEVIHTPDRAEVFAPHQHHTHSYLEAVTGLVDLARVSGEEEPLELARGAWEATLARTMWVSGGIPEVYGEPFEHNDETCSAVSWLLLNLALYRAEGDLRFADVAEHVLLNHLSFDQVSEGGFCGDRSLSRRFTVTAANRGVVADECCSMSGPRGFLEALRYAITGTPEGVDVCFFLPATARVPVGRDEVTVQVTTDYPASGTVTIQLDPPQGDLDLVLRLRRPSWLVDEPALFVNDAPVRPGREDGALVLRRKWRKGDRVRYEMDLPVALVRAGENGFNAPRTVLAPRAPTVYRDAAILRGPLLLMIDRGRSGRVPEEPFRIGVPTDAGGRLRPVLVPAGPSRAPFLVRGVSLEVRCRKEDAFTGPAPSSLDATWDPIRLYPLSETTMEGVLEPDGYVARFNAEILPPGR